MIETVATITEIEIESDTAAVAADETTIMVRESVTTTTTLTTILGRNGGIETHSKRDSLRCNPLLYHYYHGLLVGTSFSSADIPKILAKFMVNDPFSLGKPARHQTFRKNTSRRVSDRLRKHHLRRAICSETFTMSPDKQVTSLWGTQRKQSATTRRGARHY